MHYTKQNVYEFVSKQANDPIVERKTCRISGTKFPIYQSDLVFYDKISPTFSGEKFQVPTPTLCPEERQRRRMAWRNERFLFKRKCNATGKDIISMYAPDAQFPVYTADVWWSDAWSGFDYGFVFDHQKTFTEQFQGLISTVPRLFMYNLKSENSEYSNCSSDMKNCYLVTAGLDCEDCYYSNYIYHSKDCVDTFMVFGSERLYACVECTDCESCQYCYNTRRSTNSYFLTNCDNCLACFGCVNLVGKQWCWFNKQLKKEEYLEHMAKIDMGSYKQVQHIKKLYKEFVVQHPRPATMTMQTHESIGNYSAVNCKKCSFSYDIANMESTKYSYRFRGGKDCYDVFSWGTWGERLYECVQVGDNVSNCMACQGVDSESSYCYYSSACSNCHYCFGCNGLKSASYCIFNVQYTKEEWEEEVAKIITTMQKTQERGEMLDPEISVVGYNWSVAQEFMPLDQQFVESMGYVWSSYELPPVAIAETLSTDAMPDRIQDTDDATICKHVLKCEMSGKLYRITKQEYEFYVRNTIPLPRYHVDVRVNERLQERPAREMHLRTCDKTGVDVLSVYPQDCGFPVWQENEFIQEVYG